MKFIASFIFVLGFVGCTKGSDLVRGLNVPDTPTKTTNSFTYNESSKVLTVQVMIDRDEEKKLDIGESIKVYDRTISDSDFDASTSSYILTVSDFSADDTIKVEQTLMGTKELTSAIRTLSLPTVTFTNITLSPEPQSNDDLSAMFNFTTREDNSSEVCVETSEVGKPDSEFEYFYEIDFSVDLSQNSDSFLENAEFSSGWSAGEDKIYSRELQIESIQSQASGATNQYCDESWIMFQTAPFRDFDVQGMSFTPIITGSRNLKPDDFILAEDKIKIISAINWSK